MTDKNEINMDNLKLLPEIFLALDHDPITGITIINANELARVHHPPFTPGQSVLVTGIDSANTAAKISRILPAYYPSGHQTQVVQVIENNIGKPEKIAIQDLGKLDLNGSPAYLYIPALNLDSSFESFQDVVARLRAPGGCPWDQEQTHLSLRPHLLEEAYEVLDAMDRQDGAALREELGDLLLQIVLNAQIAFEGGTFKMTDVLEGINRKIVRRHPHVFGDFEVGGVDGVLKNWEKLKETERVENGEDGSKGLLDGVPKAIPALTLAEEYQDRAARVGFDWAEITPVIAKVREELDEVLAARDERSRAGELGDLLFAVVNLARWYKVDAESALRQTSARFASRFKHIESQAGRQGRKLSEMTLAEMDEFWEEAKDNEE
jgi:tetrapyrrole methylase family protein/MazG family protein